MLSDSPLLLFVHPAFAGSTCAQCLRALDGASSAPCLCGSRVCSAACAEASQAPGCAHTPELCAALQRAATSEPEARTSRSRLACPAHPRAGAPPPSLPAAALFSQGSLLAGGSRVCPGTLLTPRPESRRRSALLLSASWRRSRYHRTLPQLVWLTRRCQHYTPPSWRRDAFARRTSRLRKLLRCLPSRLPTGSVLWAPATTTPVLCAAQAST